MIKKFLTTGAIAAMVLVGTPAVASAAPVAPRQSASATQDAPAGLRDRIERIRERNCERRRGFRYDRVRHRCVKIRFNRFDRFDNNRRFGFPGRIFFDGRR